MWVAQPVPSDLYNGVDKNTKNFCYRTQSVHGTSTVSRVCIQKIVLGARKFQTWRETARPNNSVDKTAFVS